MKLPFNDTLTLSVDVDDWDLAIRFYGESLGLTLLYEAKEVGFAEFETAVPGLTLGINLVERAAGSQSFVPTFGVDDIVAARASLETSGVEFTGGTEEIEGMVKLAYFNDPFGNRYCLAESDA